MTSNLSRRSCSYFCCIECHGAQLLRYWRVSPTILFHTRSQPPSSDAFCLFYDAQTKTVKALNGSGRSPVKLTLDYMRQRGVNGSKIPLTDLNSVTVPGTLPSSSFFPSRHTSETCIGAAAAWVDTVEKFGSQKVSIGDVLAPAIRLAEEGYTKFKLLPVHCLILCFLCLGFQSPRSTVSLYD